MVHTKVCVFLLVVLALALTLSCLSSREREVVSVLSNDPQEQLEFETDSNWRYAKPFVSLEGRVATADVIVKGRLLSTDVVATQSYPVYGSKEDPLVHIVWLEFTFGQLEYLKGTGDRQVTAVVEVSKEYDTAEEARAARSASLTLHDTRWDNREAVLFLYKGGLPPGNGSKLLLGYTGPTNDKFHDRYSLYSISDRVWLPSVVGARGSTTRSGSQAFLLSPNGGGAGGSDSRRSAGQSGSSTITLAKLKAKIAKFEGEVADGDGSDDYRRCVQYKYMAESRVAALKAANDFTGSTYFTALYDGETIASGSPAGTLAYEGFQLWGGEPEPGARPAVYVLLGKDGHLFTGSWESLAHTKRPLPAGEYRFYLGVASALTLLCNAIPEEELKRTQVRVTVVAPEGVLHEALFDPQAIGSGVGYISSGDLSTGDLSPAAFSTGDTTTTGDATTTTGDTITISSLYATGDAVTMSLSPYVDLTGHTFDFITGDGTTSLTLTGDAATGDSTAGTLTWAVSSQPWSSGDQLMLRITEPWFGVRVDLSPREEGSRTLTDITISWADPQTCSDGYFVALYDGDTVVRTLGYPDATTTSISNSTGMQWDSIPSLTSTARVNCMDNNWRLVGDVPLTSGLP